MTTFLKYGAHNRTLEECEKRGIRNKNGKPFHRHSLITLLTNTKYIGKWYLNLENKTKPQERLSESEQYREIDLPHGCLIDMDLWNQVQKKVIALANSSGKHKNGDNRVYPLSSGLLRYRDGTHFKGYGGNGRTQSSYYYRNVSHKLNIKAPVLEEDALKVLTEIVQKGPRFQEAIKRFGSDVSDHIQYLELQLTTLEGQLRQVVHGKKEYLENLGTLLKSCDTPEEIKSIKNGFKDHLSQITDKQKDLELQIEQTRRNITESRGSKFSWNNIGNQAERVLSIIAENDPQALKQAYHALFSKVVVGDEDANGVRPIEYVLSETAEDDDYGPRSEMVEAESALQLLDITK